MFPTIRVVGLSSVVAVGLWACVLAGEVGGEQTRGRKPPVAAARGSASGNTAGHLSATHAALAAGDGRLALSLLDARASRFSPAERHSVEGRAHLLLSDCKSARRKLETALRLRPKQASDLYWLGRAYDACGLPASAAARYQEAHWNGLETADLHYHWARALHALNEWLGAVGQRRWPESAEGRPLPGRFALGGLVVGPVRLRPGWVLISPPNSAIYQAHRALELGPRRGGTLLLCGEIWAAVKRHSQAIPFFEEASTKLAQDDVAHCRQGWASSLLALGDLDGYLKQARLHVSSQGTADAKRLAACHDLAAREAAKRGNLKQQTQYLTLAVELEPGIERLLLLADALKQAQRIDEASARLQQALRLGPTRKQRARIRRRLQVTTFLSPPKQHPSHPSSLK